MNNFNSTGSQKKQSKKHPLSHCYLEAKIKLTFIAIYANLRIQKSFPKTDLENNLCVQFWNSTLKDVLVKIILSKTHTCSS